MKTEQIQQTYEVAKARYADLGIDTEAALAALQKISLSLHCWQADDVTGFENQGGDLTGGIQATGNYPGKARNIEELRADILKAKSFIPGKHRLNLHEIYGEFGGEFIDRDRVEPKHFQGWIDWAKQNGKIKSVKNVLLDSVSAVSVGVIDGEPMLDLPYVEDSRAMTDMNVAMTGSGKFVEIQGTAEHRPFSRNELGVLLDLATKGNRELQAAQQAALDADLR